ncbi:hypothetical protein DUT91_11600 [Phyllobacterium salinisoli]|uniref:Uncharacterized protein n=1 Tax=Phyllobacterium salinisoli TaxID=1899321 RepID=A0A368K611_9HYPH|nr:hypothetical protein [Phyllobacterium salinisoli]RCS23903.1 hypothetical protein DUT91_11600 [Phyllobacterium salinisoli]
MFNHVNDDIVVNLKDRLRDIRHVIRQVGSNSQGRRLTNLPPKNPAELPEMLLGTAATFVDTALTMAETISISLISDHPARGRTNRIGSLKLYFSHPDGRRLFHREMYHLTKEVLRRSGRGDAFIHEAAFADVYISLARNHGNVFARALAQDASTRDIAKACAVLTIESVRRHPAKTMGTASPLPASVALQPETEILVFSTIGLAYAVATTQPQDTSAPTDDMSDLLESAFLAVSAREDRFAAAFASEDPCSALAELFSRLVVYLP